MNIVSTMVGLSIMGAAAPSMVTMSLAPIEAQKRAENFAAAESYAVVFAAAHEGKADANIPDPIQGTCQLDRSNKPAYTISCTHGEGKYEMTVERSFKGEPPSGGSNSTSPRTFDFPINPYGFSGIECHEYQNWGTAGAFRAWNVDQQRWTKASCVPSIMRTQQAFDNSEPDEWLWDVNGLHDRGNHPDY